MNTPCGQKTVFILLTKITLMNLLSLFFQKVEKPNQFIDSDFNWILKVLHSCESLKQIHNTELLFLIFLKNNKRYFKSLGRKDLYKQILKDEFYSEVRNQRDKVKKI
jgi:hypothetical protein